MANALISVAVLLSAVSNTGTGGNLEVSQQNTMPTTLVTPIGRELVNIKKGGRISNWQLQVNDSAYYEEESLLQPFVLDEQLKKAFAIGLRASKINSDTLKALMNG